MAGDRPAVRRVGRVRRRLRAVRPGRLVPEPRHTEPFAGVRGRCHTERIPRCHRTSGSTPWLRDQLYAGCQDGVDGGQGVRHHGPVTSIHLRPITESDLPVLDRLAVDPRIAGPFDWHGFADPGARRRRLAEDGFLGRDPRNLAVALDQDDSCIGDVSWLAVPTGPTSTCWNVGIVILPEFRGKGYGTTAQRLLAEYLFATTTANRAEAGTDVENLAEQRALEKAGFIREGIRRGSQFRDGKWRDMAIYGRLRDDPAPAAGHCPPHAHQRERVAWRSMQWEGLAPFFLGAGPEDAPLALVDGHVVDARLTAPHQPLLVELPQFVAVAAVPLTGGVVRLVLEPDGDPVAVERPHVLAQRVVQFAAPLAPQELGDLRAPGEELVPVPPHRIHGVGARDPLRVPGVPGVLGGLDLLAGGRLGERRQRRSRAHGSPCHRGSTCGLSIPSGSNADLIRAKSARSASDRTSGSQRAFSAPTPCSAELDPPSEATKPNTASSCRPSASAAGTTLTCRFPSATCP